MIDTKIGEIIVYETFNMRQEGEKIYQLSSCLSEHQLAMQDLLKQVKGIIGNA